MPVIISAQNAGSNPTADSINYQALKFKYMLERIVENHPDEYSISEIADSAFKSIFRSIDKHSAYYSIDEMAAFREQTTGTKYGIGISLSALDDTLRIVQIEPNSAASSSDLQSGDMVIFIDDKNVTGEDAASYRTLLSGEDSTNITMLIKKPDAPDILKEYTFMRGSIPSTSINSAFLLPGTTIAYINLNRFSDRAGEEFTETMTEMVASGAESIMLDLRDNGGGDIRSTVDILDKLINTRDTLVRFQSANPDFRVAYAGTGDGRFENMPLLVVINENSASGAELVAATVQEYDRGLLVGETSFGKGSAQKVYNLGDSSAFKLTVAHYYTSVGRNLEKQEIKDEGELPFDIEQNADISDIIKKDIRKFGNMDKMPIFTSHGGRTIIGGGGVIPDRFIKRDTNNTLTTYLIKRGVFLEFALKYKIALGDTLMTKLNGVEDFIQRFKVNDELIKSFAYFAQSKKTWNNELYKQDADKIKAFLKGYIAYIFFDNNAYRQTMISTDNVIIEARKLMPKSNYLSN